MGSRRIPNATNEKIIALMSMGTTAEKSARICNVSSSYCDKLYKVTKYISNCNWDDLITYSKTATTGGVITWACEYLNTSLPQEVTNAINVMRYRNKSVESPPTSKNMEDIDNTATAIIKLLEKLDAAVSAITEAADDICQTITTERKLNEDCLNANFDVLTKTARDGIESVKTTIRKGNK